MKKKNTSVLIGKILIFLSFLIIISGSLYSIVVKTGVIDISNNVLVPHSDDKITINTFGGDSSGSNGIVVGDQTGVVEQTSPSNDNIGVTSPNNVPSNNYTPVIPSTPTPSNPVQNNTPAVDNVLNTVMQQNESIRQSIKNQYGITIKYGSETSGYSVGGFSTNTLDDVYVIQSELNILKNNFALYPSGFFRELTNSIPLSIYLVDSYSGANICGVTDSNYSRAIMSLSRGSEFVETFHHENYHYMERYIFKNGGSFDRWALLNPIGFDYEGQNNSSYEVYTSRGSSDVYFVNVYSRDSSQYEDRASVFEYMMATNKAACLNYGMPVYYKAIMISDKIDEIFSSCSSYNTEYWERFIR